MPVADGGATDNDVICPGNSEGEDVQPVGDD